MGKRVKRVMEKVGVSILGSQAGWFWALKRQKRWESGNNEKWKIIIYSNSVIFLKSVVAFISPSFFFYSTKVAMEKLMENFFLSLVHPEYGILSKLP